MQKLLAALSEFVDVASSPCRVRTVVPLGPLVRQIVTELLDDDGPSVKVEVGTLPAVEGDRDRLALLFRHLLDNALRYGKSGTPRVQIGAEERPEAWVIRVEDDGGGIGPEFRGKIFEPYMRLHGKEIPGTGLGLAVCRLVVEGMGGRIWVDSGASGRGAVFGFTLPRAA